MKFSEGIYIRSNCSVHSQACGFIFRKSGLFYCHKDDDDDYAISSPEPARIYGQRDRNATDSGIIKNRMPLFRLPVF